MGTVSEIFAPEWKGVNFVDRLYYRNYIPQRILSVGDKAQFLYLTSKSKNLRRRKVFCSFSFSSIGVSLELSMEDFSLLCEKLREGSKIDVSLAEPAQNLSSNLGVARHLMRQEIGVLKLLYAQGAYKFFLGRSNDGFPCFVVEYKRFLTNLIERFETTEISEILSFYAEIERLDRDTVIV